MRALNDHDAFELLGRVIASAVERCVTKEVRWTAADVFALAQSCMNTPGHEPMRRRLTTMLTALDALVAEFLRPCEVCNDVGAVNRGEPCPTGCNASKRNTSNPEPNLEGS